MKTTRRYFLKSLAIAGGTLPLISGAWRQALAAATGYPRLLHGPMAGSVGQNDINIWMRSSGRYQVSIQYGKQSDLSDARHSKEVQTGPENDFVAHINISGLEADTKYYYRPWVDGKPAKYMDNIPPFQFKTAPAKNAKFLLGFGSCARWQEFPDQPIWDALDRWDPDLFCWLGDNIYADTVEPGIMSDLYKIQRSVPELQGFCSRVPQLAIWDDHDYGLNNSDKDNPMKEESLKLFKRYWANPSYGTEQSPGVFFQYNYAGVDFFFLDNRYHRDSNGQPDGPDKSHLGSEQLAWLKDGLKASSAPFKVLICGGGWSYNPDSFGEDNWTSYRHERNNLFDFIRDQHISGVLLMSGDIHRSEANCIPWSAQGGYDLYEFASSGLAQDTPMPESIETPEIRLREPFTGGHNAGLLEFDLTQEDPVVKFNVINFRAQTVWDNPITIRASELRNGISSWKQKVDPELPAPLRADVKA
ncbi:alkaline phosphatase D family protein [Lacimicrobium alkaliphilum]|uniref:PhoD-like phosphatase metallophosphatase domain-containing protein n=1 Tax=Lacimicrobium alkaliphilum TaxID=1526571 RepID=A0A0U3AXE0_9ALTE|nr:alkaline phosphatase D family protein [Lacimicrobium alkaliphilum]ALS97552.1 hypothetical protein AT746_04220 [Lacimicrobium alkaliphilum]